MRKLYSSRIHSQVQQFIGKCSLNRNLSLDVYMQTPYQQRKFKSDTPTFKDNFHLTIHIEIKIRW